MAQTPTGIGIMEGYKKDKNFRGVEKFCRISKFTLHNSFSVQKLHTT